MFIINATVITPSKTLVNHAIEIENSVIKRIFAMEDFQDDGKEEIIDAKGNLVSPGLIDTHIHGFAGYGTEDVSTSSILAMSKALKKVGVTSFFPTLYPNSKKVLFDSLEAIAKAKGNEQGANIAGIHIEGPFVSPDKVGALPRNSISPIDLDYFNEIIKHGHGLVKCMTVAPELEGIEKLIKTANKHNVVLLAGHTSATYEQALYAIKKGIRHTTHFFNAMSPLNHRNPGMVGAVLTSENSTCELIADGVHVHKDLVKYVVDKKGSDKIVLITDSLKPNHQTKGSLFANGVEVVLSKSGAFVSKDNPSLLNGSALTLNKALKNLSSWGVPAADAIAMATLNPAKIYNLEKVGSIKKGYKSDLVIFDNNFNVLKVI